MEPIITKEKIQQAVDYIKGVCPDVQPEVAMILGSGLGGLAAAIENPTVIKYDDVPHLIPSTMQLHAGQFVIGELSGKKVICMQGRIHAYEGNTAQQIALPVFVMSALGAKTLIVTNAAGGIRPEFNVGDLMLITDHINVQFMNPCIGLGEGLGPQFFDMTHAYAPELRRIASIAAEHCGIELRRGVYIGDLGPSFETPAEIRAFRVWGADAVGMSTVQETIAANQQGMKVLGISLISNPAAGVSDEPLDMDDVVKAAKLAAERMETLVKEILTLI